MTAHKMTGDRRRCLAAGMDDYTTKPIDPEEIDRQIRRWVDRAPVAVGVPDAPAATATGEAASVFDARGALARTVGRRDLFERLLGEFMADLPASVTRIADAARDRDREALRRTAHRLRGAALTLCMADLAAGAARVESAASGTPEAEMDRLARDLAAEAERAAGAVATTLAGGSAAG